MSCLKHSVESIYGLGDFSHTLFIPPRAVSMSTAHVWSSRVVFCNARLFLWGSSCRNSEFKASYLGHVRASLMEENTLTPGHVQIPPRNQSGLTAKVPRGSI